VAVRCVAGLPDAREEALTPNAQTFKAAFDKAGKKLDMGKSCVRFKSVDDLELEAIGDAIAAMQVDDYIAYYEKSRLKTKADQRGSSKTKKSGPRYR